MNRINGPHLNGKTCDLPIDRQGTHSAHDLTAIGQSGHGKLMILGSFGAELSFRTESNPEYGAHRRRTRPWVEQKKSKIRERAWTSLRIFDFPGLNPVDPSRRIATHWIH